MYLKGVRRVAICEASKEKSPEISEIIKLDINDILFFRIPTSIARQRLSRLVDMPMRKAENKLKKITSQPFYVRQCGDVLGREHKCFYISKVGHPYMNYAIILNKIVFYKNSYIIYL